jgi:hypothetical protein
VAGVAAHAQEPVLQPPALQVILKLALNVARQAAAGRAQRREKLRVMTLDEGPQFKANARSSEGQEIG